MDPLICFKVAKGIFKSNENVFVLSLELENFVNTALDFHNFHKLKIITNASETLPQLFNVRQ